MRRPTVGLRLVMEWVAAAAAGFGVTRAGGEYDWTSTYDVHVAVAGFLAGFAAVEAVIVTIEAVRRRRTARNWGVGRQAWLMTGLYLLLLAAYDLALNVAAWSLNWYVGESRIDYELFDFSMTRDGAMDWHFPMALVAGVVAGRVARGPADRRPDAREWAGRVYVGLLVGVLVISTLLDEYRAATPPRSINVPINGIAPAR